MEPSAATSARRGTSFSGGAAAAVSLLTLTVLSFGTVRVNPEAMDFEWQNGWPLVFLSRHAEIDTSQSDGEAWIPRAAHRFSPAAAALDGLVAACACIAVYLMARRRWPSRKPQFGLRGLLIAVLGVAALLGWGLRLQRRQARAVERLEREDIHFGFHVDQGLPNCVRRWLPGGRLRPFDRITWITCGGPNCVDRQMAALADLRDVEFVEIMSNEMRDGGLDYLAHLQNLTRLSVAGPTHIGDFGVAHLSGLRRLTTLDLGSSDITDGGVASLGCLVRLESLDLPFCRISDAGLAHLARLRELRRLILTASDVSDASVPLLMEFKKLDVLDVRDTRITSEGIASMKQALPACQVFGP